MKTTNTTVTLFTEVSMLIKSRMQRTIKLPFSQYQTLWFVAEHTNPSMQEVARHFKIRAPSATFLVEELVRAGELERIPNANDRRKVELRLTAKGKRTFKQLQEKRNKVLSSIFGSLPESDQKELTRILEKIIKTA